MSEFTDLVARAVSPSMSREEREAVYTTVREAVRRLQDRQEMTADDPRTLLQDHLIDETIRDIEERITRHLARQTIAERDTGSGGPDAGI
ncbi:hypothetical protein [Methylobacterium oryzihabitans]|uniref:Uncharacterized protein n=1 Tax=Methylobacterium oryzihabitans TaxID=2499852 RepID=A0A3S2XQL2_9HYPH|nr:hypothetical protein [Methylobacterium oryzihabitans]RVU20601.1 hypothetical protein EOE48_04410 [Methylobacterium oryzihabitans]